MSDITDLIFEDHTWFREQFAVLDDLRATRTTTQAGTAELERVWRPLADRLDVHAVAEEEIFYPQLLRVGEDPEDETLDAIGDHNDIRDGVRDAENVDVGSDEWWAAVDRARLANDEHRAEEEREGLANFRRTAPSGLREALGRRFAAYFAEHPSRATVDTSDKDPEEYVEANEDTGSSAGPERTPEAGGLGIGSLKGQ
ncbi:hemerythrin domain-containing protein [Rhodococcus sp. HNM0569]|uniref:hemerythrin domain-containing protein n=1 Tax=Rhodococcus sp. HNM0569 TaxID=2716340 RepID=UPI00146A9ADF|nr:hemerythrin domain-containing protein [Rhodococcus sp. HNM0569]NLU84221.1 hemerythrin domain-containing protein [Rhodococcus sp. HNM0569]